jgi:hypothetical protein
VQAVVNQSAKIGRLNWYRLAWLNLTLCASICVVDTSARDIRINKMIPMESALQLFSRLQFAAAIFDPSAAGVGRKSAIVSLVAINDFLIAVGIQDKSVHLPLNELIYALEDLNRGRVRPLVQKAKVAHRSKNSVADEFFRTLAAAAMDLHMMGKVRRKEAAHLVARELTKMGYRHPTAGRIAAQHVEDWRDRILEEAPRSEPMRQFRRAKDAAMRPFPNQPVAAAKFLLTNLPIAFQPQLTKRARFVAKT